METKIFFHENDKCILFSLALSILVKIGFYLHGERGSSECAWEPAGERWVARVVVGKGGLRKLIFFFFC